MSYKCFRLAFLLNFRSKVVVEWLAILLHILDASGPNLDPETVVTD